MRRALIARDRGCRFPGCDRPPAWTDGHHLKHWADGGPTLPFNLALLCGRHHYRVHEEGWRLAWGGSGELIAIPP
ncbi:MAG: HNH endonuclease [Candidatus Dormibacteraeota bacterium]|nr:HNH endonuclease [Candidatus Dormibacteraeota bacterium]